MWLQVLPPDCVLLASAVHILICEHCFNYILLFVDATLNINFSVSDI